MKRAFFASALAAFAVTVAAVDANAATVVVTNAGTTPNNLPLTLVPTGPGTYTGGSSDTIVSSGNNITRNFSLNYNFTAPEDGMGSISFTTTSVAPNSSLLAITSAFFNGTPVTITTDTAANGARTFSGNFDFMNATFGDAFTLTLNGTVRRGGTLSTSLSFAGATGGVPEPATWALMILGFGAVGGAMRRRQAVAAKVRFA